MDSWLCQIVFTDQKYFLPHQYLPESLAGKLDHHLDSLGRLVAALSPQENFIETMVKHLKLVLCSVFSFIFTNYLYDCVWTWLDCVCMTVLGGMHHKYTHRKEFICTVFV